MKEALYENVEIPEELGPRTVLVDEHAVKRYAFTVDDYLPWAFGESPFGGRVAQAALLANDLLTVYYEQYDRDTVVGLHAEEELWFHAPARVGERVEIRGRYVGKEVRRGKGYVVLEAEARGEDGRLLVRHRGVEIMRAEEGHAGGGAAPPPQRRVSCEVRADLPEAERVTARLEPGTPVAPLRKRLTQEQIAVFSNVGTFHRNIHTDLERARSIGLERPIAQGQMTACYVSELGTRLFGPAWLTGGWERLKFLKPVGAGTTLELRGAVLGPVDDGQRVELEVWATDDAGERTAVGWISGPVEP